MTLIYRCSHEREKKEGGEMRGENGGEDQGHTKWVQPKKVSMTIIPNNLGAKTGLNLKFKSGQNLSQNPLKNLFKILLIIGSVDS